MIWRAKSSPLKACRNLYLTLARSLLTGAPLAFLPKHSYHRLRVGHTVGTRSDSRLRPMIARQPDPTSSGGGGGDEGFGSLSFALSLEDHMAEAGEEVRGPTLAVAEALGEALERLCSRVFSLLANSLIIHHDDWNPKVVPSSRTAKPHLPTAVSPASPAGAACVGGGAGWRAFSSPSTAFMPSLYAAPKSTGVNAALSQSESIVATRDNGSDSRSCPPSPAGTACVGGGAGGAPSLLHPVQRPRHRRRAGPRRRTRVGVVTWAGSAYGIIYKMACMITVGLVYHSHDHNSHHHHHHHHHHLSSSSSSSSSPCC
jgi:hypothetical protein